MRCPDCNKFASLETQEPESPDMEVEFNGDDDAPGFHITGSVRIVRTCADCGNELKEATLDIDQEVELGEDLTAEESAHLAGLKPSDYEEARVEDESIETLEEGGGRYAKSYYGAQATFAVYVHDVVVARVMWSDKIAASAMDELV